MIDSRPDTSLSLSLHDTIAAIPAAQWDACADPPPNPGAPPGAIPHRALDPFTTHRFLAALEASGSVGGRTGWQPQHLALREGDRLVAVMPLYLKTHSQGEYVFDHGWAEAWQRAGGRYYPKLQAAVPFTPVTGRRFLTLPGYETIGQRALLTGLAQITDEAGLSSAHITFCTESEAEAGRKAGLLHRKGQQFHWHNQGYGDFDAFLAALSARKRKAIRRERARALGFGGQIQALTGADIAPAHWDAVWAFYQDTGSRKWGRPYLTRGFFEQAHASLRDDIVLILASRAGQPVAGALNFLGRDCLYGRYWGAIEDHDALHFECCYYQAIDWAIGAGLARVEAGAQGAHKLARGYLPQATHSLHLIPHPGFREAVAQFLKAEDAALTEEFDVLTAYGPFRRGPLGGGGTPGAGEQD